jgi:hypothetical protein
MRQSGNAIRDSGWEIMHRMTAVDRKANVIPELGRGYASSTIRRNRRLQVE